MKDDEGIIDRRSTGRKRGRAVLIRLTKSGERDYICADCGHIPAIPYDTPSRSGDILECNHRNKNIMDCDPVNLEWLCYSCHGRKDKATGKGVSSVDDGFGYSI